VGSRWAILEFSQIGASVAFVLFMITTPDIKHGSNDGQCFKLLALEDTLQRQVEQIVAVQPGRALNRATRMAGLVLCRPTNSRCYNWHWPGNKKWTWTWIWPNTQNGPTLLWTFCPSFKNSHTIIVIIADKVHFSCSGLYVIQLPCEKLIFCGHTTMVKTAYIHTRRFTFVVPRLGI
jgi:hypothetical protein